MPYIPVPIDSSAINRRLTAMENSIRSMQGARSLSAATISDGGLTIRDGGGLTVRDGGDIAIRDGGILLVDGSTTIGGSLDVTGPATFSGDTTIGGNAKITGTLSLPAGIIDNEALASPASFGRTGGAQTGFSIPVAGTDVAVQTIPVPAGYSSAIVMAMATVSAKNSTTSTDYLYVGAKIGTVEPNATFAQAAPDGWAALSGSATRLVTGLDGGTITVAARVRTDFGTWTDVSNTANVDAIAVFLR